MTPLKLSHSQVMRLERNLKKQEKAPKKESPEAEIVVTVHISPDCRPETLKALAEMMKLLTKQMEEKKS